MECLWKLQLPLQPPHTRSRTDRVFIFSQPRVLWTLSCLDTPLPRPGWLLLLQLLAMALLNLLGTTDSSLNSPPQAWIEYRSKLASELQWNYTPVAHHHFFLNSPLHTQWAKVSYFQLGWMVNQEHILWTWNITQTPAKMRHNSIGINPWLIIKFDSQYHKHCNRLNKSFSSSNLCKQTL